MEKIKENVYKKPNESFFFSLNAACDPGVGWGTFFKSIFSNVWHGDGNADQEIP